MYLHLGREAAHWCEAGLFVGEVGNAGLELKEAVNVHVNVASLAEIGQSCAVVICVVAMGVATRQGVHQGVVVCGVGVRSDAGSTILKEGEGPGELFLLGELFGGVDELESVAPFSEVAAPIVRGRVELQRGAGLLVSLLQFGGELI